MTTTEDMVDFTETHSGRHFHFLDPKPEDIHIHDIAVGLGRMVRWNGQSQQPVTVAQHSVLTSRRIRAAGYDYPIQMQGLMHDAAEAYIGDVPSPVKRHLPDFRAMELVIEAAIFERFKIPYPMDQIVKTIDTDMYRWEYRDLMTGDLCREPVGNPPHYNVWPAGSAIQQFLILFWELHEEMA